MKKESEDHSASSISLTRFIVFGGGSAAMRNFQNLDILVFLNSEQMDGFYASQLWKLRDVASPTYLKEANVY